MPPRLDMQPDHSPTTVAGEPTATAAGVPLLLIIGPPGVGKSSAARHLGRLLEDGRVGCACVDRDDFGVDGLLDEDPLVDLQEILLSHVAAGAQRLVVAWRIESDAELDRFRAQLPWSDITVCRLRAATGELLDRIAGEQHSFQRLHLQSMALEMAPRLERQASEDILLATDDAPPQLVAVRALRQWRTAQAGGPDVEAAARAPGPEAGRAAACAGAPDAGRAASSAGAPDTGRAATHG